MDQLYSISVALLIIVVIFIPIMLFTTPCLACGNSGEHHAEHSIELVSQHSGGDEPRLLHNNAIQSNKDNSGDSSNIQRFIGDNQDSLRLDDIIQRRKIDILR